MKQASLHAAHARAADLRAAWAFNPDWTLEARANNMLDKDYETVAWYYQPGREYGLSLRWSPVAR